MPRLKRTATQSDETGNHANAPNLFVHSMPGHYIRRVQQVAVRLFAEGIAGDMTPVQFAALSALADAPDIGQATLAGLIGYDRATIGGVIDRLEAKGFVRRRADPDDRRSNILSMTAEGRKALEAARPQVEAVQEKLLSALNAEEKREFEALCRRIIAANGG